MATIRDIYDGLRVEIDLSPARRTLLSEALAAAALLNKRVPYLVAINQGIERLTITVVVDKGQSLHDLDALRESLLAELNGMTTAPSK